MATARRVLTLKYRPQTFDEVLIQTHVTDTLKRAIEKNRLANAYLFTGPRGVGKTTTARILAKSLNCENGPTTTPCNKCSSCVEITNSRSMDVIELDGASNRGIDQVRELRENIKYSPTAGRYKVYIIDEVHMLTKEAFNALLKTLEEPPAHAKFIFATTAAHEVPTTIISRCQRFDFRKASPQEIKDRLEWMAGRESIKATEPALMAIARRADGALRDGESILDQLAAYRPDGIELKDVEELLGIVPGELFFDYAGLVLTGDAPGLVRFLDRLFESGYDHMEFYTGVVQHFRGLLLLDVSGSAAGLSLLPDEARRMTEQAGAFGRERLLRLLAALTQAETAAKTTRLPRVLLELTSLELASAVPGGNRTPAAAAGPTAKSDPAPVKASDGPLTAETLWSEFRLRLNAHKQMLASMTDHATLTGYSSDVLTITFPAKNQTLAESFKANAGVLQAMLTDIAGRPTKIEVRLSKKPGPDPTRERVKGIFGRIEEERSE